MANSDPISYMPGLNRVLVKLNNAIDKGEYYEAHQMYRTVYFRYMAQKKFDECLELLYRGATDLLSKKQESSAADLGLLILETLDKRHKETPGNDNFNETWFERLTLIVCKMSSSNIDRETLLQKAIAWSSQLAGHKYGHPSFHKYLALHQRTEDNMESMRQHYLLCQDGEFCANMLIRFSIKKGYESEVDLFIVQAVLQQLCLNDQKTAKGTFKAYIAGHPLISKKQFPYKLPLLNFLYFLFTIIKTKDIPAFRTLIQLYEPSLSRDPAFSKYLKKIAISELGDNSENESERRGMGGIFDNLISSFVRDLDQDEGDNPNTSSTNPQTPRTQILSADLD